jgi:signal transduction histidine kinase
MIHLEQIEKTYAADGVRYSALRRVDLDIAAGQLVAIMGKSGSGKTTLLNIMTGLDVPTAGRVTVAGTSLATMSETALAKWRGRSVGIVFQFFQLLPALTAVARAADLAHGLKTPLAVLTHEADRAEDDGHADLAAAVRQQVERMRRSVEVQLAHARAAGSGATLGAHASVLTSAMSLARALNGLYASRGIEIDVRAREEDVARCQPNDLDEILGNLLDNACKWASSRVVVSSSSEDGGVRILVDDDGPGIPADMRQAVLRRGVRADEAAPGSGLGLAIAADLIEIYGGSIALDVAPAGGLRVDLRLPRA